MAEPDQHSSPGSLLGQLQRGRGEGYLRILSAPKAEGHELLVECICNDPRLDRQVESRAEYYASIAREVDLDLSPLARYLREHDDADLSTYDTGLVIDTLGELAKREHGSSATLLSDYIAEGSRWDLALNALAATPTSERLAEAARALARRFPSESGFEEALNRSDLDSNACTKLDCLIENPGWLGEALRKRRSPGWSATPAPPELAGLSVRQILELADERKSDARFCWHLRGAIPRVVQPDDVNLLIGSISVDRPAVSLVALAGLAYLAPDRTLDWLESFHSNLPTPGYGALRHWTQHAIVSLSPELTLPLARTRLFDQRPHERMLAEDLLATHATVEDIPALRSAIKEALEDDCASCYRLCDLLHAFEHLPPGTGPVPELTDAFSRFRYSRGRGYATRAIQSTAPELFCETFAFECLWDCETETRAFAAQLVPIHDQSLGRLRALASSPWEDSQVRELASQRVTSA